MILNTKDKTVTFKRRTFDKTYRPGDVVPYSSEISKGWDKRFILAKVGEKTISLYKLRKQKDDVMIFHAFTGTPELLSRKRVFEIIGILDPK